MKYRETLIRLEDQINQKWKEAEKLSKLLRSIEDFNHGIDRYFPEYKKAEIDQKIYSDKEKIYEEIGKLEKEQKTIKKEVEEEVKKHVRDFLFIFWCELYYDKSETDTGYGHSFPLFFKINTLVKNQKKLENKILPILRENNNLKNFITARAEEVGIKEKLFNFRITNKDQYWGRISRIDGAFDLDGLAEAIEVKQFIPNVDQLLLED